MSLRVLVRGGGDLASGVILRCARAGWEVVVTELAQPTSVRRLVSFSQAIYDREISIEGISAVRAVRQNDVDAVIAAGKVAVIIDPDCTIRHSWRADVIVDARMAKQFTHLPYQEVPLYIGLGPGFSAGQNSHAVVETVRGPFLGRVIWSGPAAENTGKPDPVGAFVDERVLRAPVNGLLTPHSVIGTFLREGDLVADVDGHPVSSPFDGVLRGLIQAGIQVAQGMKIGDVDPRNDPRLCWLVSDKALAVGGGVLEAILSRKDILPNR